MSKSFFCFGFMRNQMKQEHYLVEGERKIWWRIGGLPKGLMSWIFVSRRTLRPGEQVVPFIFSFEQFLKAVCILASINIFKLQASRFLYLSYPALVWSVISGSTQKFNVLIRVVILFPSLITYWIPSILGRDLNLMRDSDVVET